MRGDDTQQGGMWSYIQPEQRVPQDHPLRPIRVMVDRALKELSPRFALLYSHTGRPSIPPEQLLRALLLQAFYSVRSERQLMEQLDYNLLFRWFVGLSMDDPIWDPTVFTKNRDRLFQGDIAQAFFTAVLTQARQANLVSAEHFTVDGTLLEAWASHKSVKRQGQPAPPPDDDPGNPTVDFRGEKRTNATHQSTTDPEAQLVRKSRGQAAILGYRGHVLMENRHGLVVGAQATQVVGASEPVTALGLAMTIPGEHRATLGGDKGYDTAAFVVGCRALRITPHVAQHITETRGSALDGRTTRHPGYAVSQRGRKRVEEVFGWLKTIGQLRKLHHRGTRLVNWVFLLRTTAYNLIRMRNLLGAIA
ncbi:MAG TPA: IS5 family transposase [Candidatus Methylomirabilis sp.]|nr:IS5 family transposase [Candidatus Methylomirabilis sp.]